MKESTIGSITIFCFLHQILKNYHIDDNLPSIKLDTVLVKSKEKKERIKI